MYLLFVLLLLFKHYKQFLGLWLTNKCIDFRNNLFYILFEFTLQIHLYILIYLYIYLYTYKPGLKGGHGPVSLTDIKQ